MSSFFRIALCMLCFLEVIYAQDVIVVTGAARGIGYAICDLLASQDYIVYAGIRKTSATHLLLESQKSHPNLHIIELDVTDQTSVEKAITEIYAKEKHIDVLVNNAGVEIYGSVENISLEEAQKLFDVNFFGTMRVTQQVLPIMREQKKGHLIQISSRSGFRPLPSLSVYAASKFAVEGLFETIAALVKPWNIHVSLIEPGPVLTEMDVLAPYGSRLARDQDPYYHIFTDAGLLDPYSPYAQKPEEIAQIVQQAMTAKQPLFRYQTTQAIQNQATLRLVDITGCSAINEWDSVLHSQELAR